jgi:predicted transcriptional regulator
MELDHSKGKANPASQQAFSRAVGRIANTRATILEVLANSEGLTGREIADQLGWQFHCVSGRVSELRAQGLVAGTGERRNGGEVVRAVREPEQFYFFNEGA